MTGSDRRRFLGRLAAWSLVCAFHRPLLVAGRGGRRAVSGRRTSPLIREIRLATAAPLSELAAFYGGSLGLRIDARTATSLTILAGASRITFTPTSSERDSPFYHFAFNIPENKLRAARDWQRERTPLIEIPTQLRDDRYPDDVVHFRNWNAHSVFFLDPAGNVVEHIARHDLANGRAGAFGPEDLLCVSEIAFATDDVTGLADEIRTRFELPRYRSASDVVTALGDEHGLLLVFRRGRNLGFESKPQRRIDVHPVDVTIDRDGGALRYHAPSYPFVIRG